MSPHRPFAPISALAIVMAAAGMWAFPPRSAVADEPQERLLLNVTFEDKKAGDDLTSEWKFLAAASSTTADLTPAQQKRATVKFIVAEDPANPANKVLRCAGGDTMLPDAFIYVPSLADAELNRGDYTAVQLDFYAQPGLKKLGPKQINMRAGPYRIGVLGYIDPGGKAVYGAWTRWSDRQLRSGMMAEGLQEVKWSAKMGKRKDEGKWFTIRAEFKRGGDQLEITGRMWDRAKGPAGAVSSTMTVPLTARKTFAVGLYQYSNSDKFQYDQRYIDNLKVFRTK